MILRGLVVLLLCMNLGVGLWWWRHSAPVPAPPPATELGTGSLVLLGEAEAPPTPEQIDAGLPPVPMPAAPACLSLGPFESPAAMRAAVTALTPLAARIQFREVQADALRYYRVFLPAAPSREQALATARAMAARGVADYYVVTAGEQENTVSLGQFRELANAEARRAQITGLGFEARLEPRTERVAQWWIDLAGEAGLDWRGALGAPVGIVARPVACGGDGAPADPAPPPGD